MSDIHRRVLRAMAAAGIPALLLTVFSSKADDTFMVSGLLGSGVHSGHRNHYDPLGTR